MASAVGTSPDLSRSQVRPLEDRLRDLQLRFRAVSARHDHAIKVCAGRRNATANVISQGPMASHRSFAPNSPAVPFLNGHLLS